MQTEMRSEKQVPKDALNSLPMRDSRTVHKLTNLINIKGNVESSKRKILETPNNGAVKLRVLK